MFNVFTSIGTASVVAILLRSHAGAVQIIVVALGKGRQTDLAT
jgi:hypothetical protein